MLFPFVLFLKDLLSRGLKQGETALHAVMHNTSRVAPLIHIAAA